MPEPDPAAYKAMTVLVEKLWMRAFGGGRYKVVIYTDANASDLLADIVLLVSMHICGSICVTGVLPEACSSNSEHLSAQRCVVSSAQFPVCFQLQDCMPDPREIYSTGTWCAELNGFDSYAAKCTTKCVIHITRAVYVTSYIVGGCLNTKLVPRCCAIIATTF